MELSYLNARVRGQRGRLLKQTDYNILLKTEGLIGFLDRLRATNYGPYIETFEARYTDKEAVLNGALNSNLADAFESVWKTAPVEARALLKAILSIWEVHDIKAIVRGVARGVNREDIIFVTIPAGEFSPAVINTLAGARDVKDLIRFLDTWGSPYARPLKEGLGQYLKNGSVTEMEINVDVSTYRHIHETIGKGLDDRIIEENLVLRIDLQNILTSIKIAGEDYTEDAVRGFFIEGGKRLRLKDFKALSGIKSKEELLKTITGLINDEDIKAALRSIDPEEAGLVEQRFEHIVEDRLGRLAVVDPLSIALSASFIFMKVREIKQLRLMARAKAFGIPDSEVRRLLTGG